MIQKEDFPDIPTEHDLKIAEVVVKIANELGKTPSQVALKWITQNRYNMFPIVGARTQKQIQENLGYDALELSSKYMQELNDVSKISLGFPGDFFRGEIVQNFAFGGSLKRIEYL